MPELPIGTVTFLFTDIEGSTRLVDELGSSYGDVLDRHRRIVREVVAQQGGHEFGTEGDALFLVFDSAPAAVRAGADIQRRVAESELRVRMGIHTGEGFLRDGDYVGLDVHRVARIAAAGHGGQILLSGAARSLIVGGLPPGTTLRDLGEHRLKDLRRPEHIFQLNVEGLAAEFPPLRGVEGEAGNLPTELTSFIGRERELEEAGHLLADTRLLTLTGPGGTGKTRLSVQLASSVRGRFPGGAWFVPLATITDPGLVPTGIAEALGLSDVQGDGRRPLQRVIDHVRKREVLLVLDNFEQVIPAADVVTELLREAPMIRIVVTSRAVLRVYGEREFPVPPLRLPDPRHLPDPAALPQYEAVALFIDRARGVKPDFEVTNENAPAVAEICARLDGLPLAIELAAARIRLLTPDAMLARMSDRLALLSGGPRDVPDRQRTLRTAIAWSYDLLEPSEQRGFARLAVFMGGWALEQAEAVCGPPEELGIDLLEGLSSLAEKSLLIVRQEGGAPEARFGMLETIREFAIERLGESGEEVDIRRRHALAYLSLAQRAAPAYMRRERKYWLDRLEPEHDNMRAALDWAIAGGEAAIALRLTFALWRFWQMRGHLQEGRAWVERVLAMPGTHDHPADRARALEAAGGIAYWQSDPPAAMAWYGEAVEIAEGLGDRKLLADELYNYAFSFDPGKWSHSFDQLKALLDRAMALYEQLGDRAGIANTHWGLGNLAYGQHDYERAVARTSQSLAEARELEEDFLTGWSLFMKGAALARLERWKEAEEPWRESLRLFAEARDLTGILFNVDGLADVALANGNAERAIRLSAAAQALKAETGAELVEEERGLRERPEHGLSEEEIARARAEGEAMTLEQAVAYALEDADPFA
ncbi:MAG: ATP-binding protein [Actinomycetota bacterium]